MSVWMVIARMCASHLKPLLMRFFRLRGITRQPSHLLLAQKCKTLCNSVEFGQGGPLSLSLSLMCSGMGKGGGGRIT
jgi:hypothetical protein